MQVAMQYYAEQLSYATIPNIQAIVCPGLQLEKILYLTVPFSNKLYRAICQLKLHPHMLSAYDG